MTEGSRFTTYKGATFTITSAIGNIAKLEFTFDGNNNGGFSSVVTPNASSWSKKATSGNGATQARMKQLVVTIAGGGETAINVANYIMYEDTNGQCETKLNIAIGYLNNTSASEFELFMNSDGYVLATARTRLYAWAANQGKVISISNNHVTLSSANIINGIGDASVRGNTTMILVITISLSLTTMVGLVILKKKKSKR